jgi:2-methylcitrate dehydratase PrpD
MTKGFHAGKAAANGVLAAALSQAGATASPRSLEAARGFFNVLAPNHDAERLLDGIGLDWLLIANSYKPYPCGIVAHPAIDGALALAPAISEPAAIRRVIVICNPLVPELMGLIQPRDGLEARFSASHCVAVGLVDQEVGLRQFEARRVHDPFLQRLRRFIEFRPAETVDRDSAEIAVMLDNGRVLSHKVDHARGSSQRPLTDAELEEKVRRLVEPTMHGQGSAVIDAVKQLANAPTVETFLQAIT